MKLPGPPDWLVYFSVLVAILLAASYVPRANSPPPPPPPPGEEDLPLDPALPFSPVNVVKIEPGAVRTFGSAFSVAESGLRLTAETTVHGCKRTGLAVGAGKALTASPGGTARGGLAVLATHGGVPALTLHKGRPKPGDRGFIPGFPQGAAGEATVRYLGLAPWPGRKRGEPERTVMVWAEAGRTDDIEGPLTGVQGAPILDRSGDVMGVVLAVSPRRGRLYSTLPEVAAKAAGATVQGPASEPVTVENYGRIADALRRDLRVAEVVCLSR